MCSRTHDDEGMRDAPPRANPLRPKLHVPPPFPLLLRGHNSRSSFAARPTDRWASL